MMRTILLATAMSSTFAFAAMAQDTKPATPPVATNPMATPTAPLVPVNILLSDQEGNDWVDKPVYSSDGKKIGEVVAFQRDPSNKVLGMHANIGGFLGMMQTRVNVMPAQFKLQSDRVVLDLTAEQAKALPKVQS